MNFLSTTAGRQRPRRLLAFATGLAAAGVIAAAAVTLIPSGAPAAVAVAAVASQAQTQTSPSAIPAVVITGGSAVAGWTPAEIQYVAPEVYAMYDDISVTPGGPGTGPDRSLGGLRVRVTVPAALVTAAQPVLGTSTVDRAGSWSYLGSSIVGLDRVFDYAYAGTLVATPAGPSPLIFGFPMTFERQAGAVGGGSVGFVLTSTSAFTYMANAGLPGGPADRCAFAGSAVVCRTDLRIS